MEGGKARGGWPEASWRPLPLEEAEKQQRPAHTGGPGSGSGQPCPQTTGRANLVHVLQTPLESLCLQLYEQKKVDK